MPGFSGWSRRSARHQSEIRASAVRCPRSRSTFASTSLPGDTFVSAPLRIAGVCGSAAAQGGSSSPLSEKRIANISRNKLLVLIFGYTLKTGTGKQRTEDRGMHTSPDSRPAHRPASQRPGQDSTMSNIQAGTREWEGGRLLLDRRPI